MNLNDSILCEQLENLYYITNTRTMVHRAWPYAKIGTLRYVDMGSPQTNTPRCIPFYGWKDNKASGSNHEFIQQWRTRTVAILILLEAHRKTHKMVSVTKSFNSST